MASRDDVKHKTLRDKEEEILARIPPAHHWRTPSRSGPLGRLRWAIFNILCIVSYGHPGLDSVWAAIRLEDEGDDSVWAVGIRQMCERMNNMLVVASLLLATSAAFITTTPPRQAIVDYTLRGPYIFLLCSFGLLIGGIIIAAVAFLVLTRARPDWSERVLYASRFHVYSTIFILSYPFFSIGLATLLLAFGILTAAWGAEDLGVQASSPLMLFLPILIIILYCVLCATANPESKARGATGNPKAAV
ncbi:hypothetical protein C8R44DRAFT_754234 [Mycena epipterygia]|nr:hypothetical protein C8R44DRAFT_754234 [Mycena epipterygia]